MCFTVPAFGNVVDNLMERVVQEIHASSLLPDFSSHEDGLFWMSLWLLFKLAVSRNIRNNLKITNPYHNQRRLVLSLYSFCTYHVLLVHKWGTQRTSAVHALPKACTLAKIQAEQQWNIQKTWKSPWGYCTPMAIFLYFMYFACLLYVLQRASF